MDTLGKQTQGRKTFGQLVFGMSIAVVATAILALAWLGAGSSQVASAGPLVQPTGTPGGGGCQFSILEFKDCIRGNCAEYEIPLKNTANDPVTVNGFVEFQGPNNQVLATQQLPSTTVPARGEIIVIGSVCVQGTLPPGPYQFRVVIRDIPRACEEKQKSQPLDYCQGAQPTPQTGTPTATPSDGTPKPTATTPPGGTPPPVGTPIPITPKPTATTPPGGTPQPTTTTPPGGTPLPITPQPTATTPPDETPPPGGTPAPGTPQPTATEVVGGSFTPEPVPTMGRPPGGMPRTGSGSSEGINGLEILLLALAMTLLIAGGIAQRRSSRREAPGA